MTVPAVPSTKPTIPRQLRSLFCLDVPWGWVASEQRRTCRRKGSNGINLAHVCVEWTNWNLKQTNAMWKLETKKLLRWSFRIECGLLTLPLVWCLISPRTSGRMGSNQNVYWYTHPKIKRRKKPGVSKPLQRRHHRDLWRYRMTRGGKSLPPRFEGSDAKARKNFSFHRLWTLVNSARCCVKAKLIK